MQHDYDDYDHELETHRIHRILNRQLDKAMMEMGAYIIRNAVEKIAIAGFSLYCVSGVFSSESSFEAKCLYTLAVGTGSMLLRTQTYERLSQHFEGSIHRVLGGQVEQEYGIVSPGANSQGVKIS